MKQHLSKLTRLHKSESLRSSRFSRANLTIFSIVFAAIGGYLIYSSFAAQAPTGLANIFIEPGAGTCTGGASSTPIDYAASASPDRRCGSFDQAWDAMSAGQTAIAKNGTYGRQFITGDKSSDTYIIGESKSGVIITDTEADCRPSFGASTVLCADGDHIWLQDITVDTNSEDGPSPGSLIAGQNVTYKNVDIFGWWPDMSIGNVYPECPGCDATGFTWDGGTWGDVNPPPRNCGAEPGGNGEPVWVYFPNVTVNDVTFNKQTTKLEVTHGGTCAVGDNPHLEFFRLESGASNFTLSNNTLLPGSDSGSGYIYSSASGVTGFRIIGNFFADNSGSTWMQLGNIAPSLIAYNTFSGDDGNIMAGNTTWVGNLGPQLQGCGGTHIKNVWGGSGSCGSDTFVGSANLGVSSDGHISAGSPAINAAETPGASDYCTDSNTVASIDFEGTTRPQGAACDAGADELGGPSNVTANLWVVPTGGVSPCVRQATPVDINNAPANAKCSSFDAANDACQNNDKVLVKAFTSNGAYPDQTITGGNSRTAMCTMQAAPGETVNFHRLVTQGSWLTIKNMDSHTGETEHMGVGGCVWCANNNANNLVLDDVNLFGKWADTELNDVTNVTWKDSELGTAGNTVERLCGQDDEPGRMAGVNNVVIDHITFHPFFGQQVCGSDSYHLETWRLWDSSDGITFSNNIFEDGRGDSSYTISSGRGGCPPQTCPNNKNIKLINNYFGNKCCGLAAQDFSHGENCVGIVLAYNFFKDQDSGLHNGCTSETGSVYVGNMGYNGGGCPMSGVVTNNVWIGDGSPGCPGNTFLPGTADDWTAYKLAADGMHLTSASPSINAGESTYCSQLTLGLDIDGDSRPQGPTCDAGADEFTGTVTPPTPPPPPGPTPPPPGPTPPPPPPPTGTLLLGNTVVETLGDQISAQQTQAWPYSAVASGSANTAVIYIDGGSTAQGVQVGIYSDSSGSPGSLLGTATISSPTSGWNSANFASPVNITNGTNYWIAALGTGTGNLMVRDRSGGPCTAKVNAAPNNWTSLKNPFGATGGNFNFCPASVYVIATSTGPKQGDINGDNSVNITDLSLLLSSYGQTTTLCTTNNSYTCDIATSGSSAGKVDIFDLSLLLSKYGS